MPQLILLFWRDIPAQVIAREGRRSVKRLLSPRFAEAIDKAAMRAGAHGSDAYLDAWRRSDPEPCGADLESAADVRALATETAYDEARLASLVANKGETP
jgi:hypothetical protein